MAKCINPKFEDNTRMFPEYSGCEDCPMEKTCKMDTGYKFLKKPSVQSCFVCSGIAVSNGRDASQGKIYMCTKSFLVYCLDKDGGVSYPREDYMSQQQEQVEGR